MNNDIPNDFEMNDLGAEYDKSVVDADEGSFDTDIKINPDYYIHLAIVRMQNALMSPNLREGFTRYRLFIEHIEVLCRAADMLIIDYDSKLDEFVKSDKYAGSRDDFKKEIDLANLKLLLMMKAVFKKKPLTDPMKV